MVFDLCLWSKCSFRLFTSDIFNRKVRAFLIPNLLLSGQFEIVGLCHVDSEALKQAADQVLEGGSKRPQLFTSYKVMFEMQGLQALVIATPTHWHALQFIAACEKGLHVFLEKPLSYDIRQVLNLDLPENVSAIGGNTAYPISIHIQAERPGL